MSTFTHKLLLPGVRFTLALEEALKKEVAQRNIAETVRRCLK